ncbi:MAG: hypothetical protein M0R46_10180 [Candidatus Muirbacterium halophilum]|nr:hypothetical protein [Candidatus Muirbacterium halophilum]
MSEIFEGIPAGNDVLTENGYLPVEDLKENDKIICAAGWGNTAISKIRKIKKQKYSGNCVKINIDSKKHITLPQKHICFSKFDTSVNTYYIVMIYRQEKGWRIGLETDIRGLNKHNLNYDDKYWILDISCDEGEAVFFQHLYSYRFGIPMVDFEVKNDKFNFSQDSIDKVFEIIETEERSLKVFEELNMFRDYPYYIAPNKKFGTKLLTLIMFGDKDKKEEEEWHSHRIYVNVDHNKISYGKTSIMDPGNRSAWNINTVRSDYDELINFANVLASFEELEIIKRSQLTPATPFFYFPASHIKKTMVLPLFNKKEKKITEKQVEKVATRDFDGDVFSLEIENLRNCIVNDVVLYC